MLFNDLSNNGFPPQQLLSKREDEAANNSVRRCSECLDMAKSGTELRRIQHPWSVDPAAWVTAIPVLMSFWASWHLRPCQTMVLSRRCHWNKLIKEQERQKMTKSFWHVGLVIHSEAHFQDLIQASGMSTAPILVVVSHYHSQWACDIRIHQHQLHFLRKPRQVKLRQQQNHSSPVTCGSCLPKGPSCTTYTWSLHCFKSHRQHAAVQERDKAKKDQKRIERVETDGNCSKNCKKCGVALCLLGNSCPIRLGPFWKLGMPENKGMKQ